MARYNLELICRICLSEKSPLADIFDPRQDLPSLLMACSAVKIDKEDGLPSHICKICAKRAVGATAFRHLCEQSDAKLRNYIMGNLPVLVTDIKKEETFDDMDDLNSLLKDESPLTPVFANNNCDLQSESSTYDCVLCNQNCNSPEELIRHAVEFHCDDYKNENLHLCSLCKRSYSSKFDLKKHQATHSEFTIEGKLNVCPICGQEFTRHVLLLKHMGYHLEDSLYECADCQCFFTTELHLKRHKKKKHNILSYNEKKKYKNTNSNEDIFTELKVKIELNHDSLNSDVKCEQNYTDFIEDDSQLENNGIMDNSLKNEYNTSSDRDVDSDYSRSEFSDHTNQNKQLTLSLKRKNKSKNFKVKLKKNKKIEKANFSNDKITNDNRDLRIEILNDTKKSTERSYLCAICGKGYSKQASLVKHIDSHANEKTTKPPQVCPICGKVVNHSNHLLVHMRTHKDKNGQPLAPQKEPDKKLILCSMCGKSCSSRSNLAVHMRRHLGVMTCICKICGKGYPRTTDLTLHMRQHTGERPFVCMHCNKGFARSDKLAIHMRIHTGEKPYSCQICTRAFAQSNDLAAHKKRNNCSQNQSSPNDNKTNLAIPLANNKLMFLAQNRGIELLTVDSPPYAKNAAKLSNLPWEPGKSKQISDDRSNSPDSVPLNLDNEKQIPVLAHDRALAAAVTNNLLVVSAGNSNNRVLDLINPEAMTARAMSDLMKQNLTVPEMLATQRALELVGVNHTNIMAAHQRGDFTDYTASLLQSISSAQAGQFDMR